MEPETTNIQIEKTPPPIEKTSSTANNSSGASKYQNEYDFLSQFMYPKSKHSNKKFELENQQTSKSSTANKENRVP